MKYKSVIKIERVTKPKRIEPDGYSSIEFINESATQSILLDGMLTLERGESFEIRNEPYVEMDSYLTISPTSTEPFACVVVKTYFFEVIE